ncbi:MAG: hypothetical protein ABIJ53_05160 [Verrucomicrobiota bacterium]
MNQANQKYAEWIKLIEDAFVGPSNIQFGDEHYILLNAAFAFAASNCTNVAFRDAWTKMLKERFVNGQG